VVEAGRQLIVNVDVATNQVFSSASELPARCFDEGFGETLRGGPDDSGLASVSFIRIDREGCGRIGDGGLWSRTRSGGLAVGRKSDVLDRPRRSDLSGVVVWRSDSVAWRSVSTRVDREPYSCGGLGDGRLWR
jgi:hypothetical protein